MRPLNTVDPLSLLILVISLGLFAQSLHAIYLMLYSWEYPERLASSRGPKRFSPPALSFTVLLPARHEEAVIRETIMRIAAANYPPELLEIAVICHADDLGTIAVAERAIAEIESPWVHLETFCEGPITKPHGLNVGLQRTCNDVVTVFDAEDDVQPEIFNVINTVMLSEQAKIVQAGVQLMNFRDRWFSAHNCLEYFFWFKSRLHFHARAGMIPLGGNTVFIQRSLLERVGGWDDDCLTEDADIGMRLSALGEPIRVVYDPEHATREETPDSVRSFVHQRTRWHQGFLQVLHRGAWLRLPRLSQRLLAAYTFSCPIFQALTLALMPLDIAVAMTVKLPVVIALISFLPLYALVFQMTTTMWGAWAFAHEYHLDYAWWTPIQIAATFVPFQALLGISALRAAYRMLRQNGEWIKTAHHGAHRQVQPSLSPAGEPGSSTPVHNSRLTQAAFVQTQLHQPGILSSPLDPLQAAPAEGHLEANVT